MSQTSRMVRPQEQGPDRVGYSLSMLVVAGLFLGAWGALVWYAGRAIGWWSE